MATVEEFVQAYSQALSDHSAAVLIGAGLSIPAGLVDWKGLMRSIAAEVGLDASKENDLIAVAQYHVNERGGRQRINQTLVNEFSERAHLTENHRILTRLPIGTYWTTNYDHLIEDALREAGKRADIKITPENLAITLPRRDALVYKMHGDVADAANAVVTKDDYESYATTRRGQLFSTALRGDLVSKTFLCVGFSFSDPNLDYIFSRIRILLETNRREHYCLVRKVQRHDFVKLAEFRYARTKQELQIRDLRRYGFIAVLLDSFEQYTDTLRRLERAYRSRQVFISGSATTYAPWTENESHRFLTLLGKRLAENGMGVITGFGLGVGPHVINGVLDHLENEGTRNLTERLTLRPFPYAITDPAKKENRWTAYRKEMVSHAGVAIFVFGNKVGASGPVSMADGMLEEFELAHSSGLLLIPVGGTGYVAERLHKQVSEDLSKYFPQVRGLKTALANLGAKRAPSDMVERILKFIALATAGH
jgi:Sir2- and TIR-associating SLOG family/SIR2-like domain